MANNVINLNDTLKTSLTITYGEENYVFDFDDQRKLAIDEVMLKAGNYAKTLKNKDDDWDKVGTEEQLKLTRDAYAKYHEIVMAYFVGQLGEKKAKQLYDSVNHSTEALTVIMGLVKDAADKSTNDARNASYPVFEGND